MALSDADYLGAIAVQKSDQTWFTVPYTSEDIKRSTRVIGQAKRRLHGRVLVIDHKKVHTILGQMVMEAYHAEDHGRVRRTAAALCVNMTAWDGQTTKFIVADTHCPEPDCPIDGHLATCTRCEAETVDIFIKCFSP